MARTHVELPGGRRIDYLELGDPAGKPALYLHGTPSSASEARWLAAAARAQGVRLVSLDRPGYLGSAPHPQSSLVAVARDVVAVADALALESFAVVGFSGGAGYALATASAAPARVTVVHIGGGLGSLAGAAAADLPLPRRLMFKLLPAAPRLSAPLLNGMFGLLRRGLEKRLDSPADAAAWFFEGPARGAQVAAVARYIDSTAPDELRDELRDYAEGTRAAHAVLDDMAAYTRPWQFDLRSLDAHVELWHGTDDPAAPIAFARRLAAELPDAELHELPGEGHFVFHAHGEEIVGSIHDRARR